MSEFPEHRRTNYTPATEKWQEVARLKVLGMSNVRIAEQLGLSAVGVANILQEPSVKATIRELQDGRNDSVMDISERMKAAAPEALSLITDIMRREQEGVSLPLALKAAESILDRAGYGRVTKNLFVGVTGHLTGDDIEALKQRAIDSGVLVCPNPSTPV